VPGYRLAYVDRIIADGSGLPVTLRGDADLELTVRPATTQGEEGGITVPTTRFVPSFPAVREAKLVGDFEGVVTFGIGASRRTGFRVAELAGPPRLVVDVAHPDAGGGAGQSTTTSRATTTTTRAQATTTSTTAAGDGGAGAVTTSSTAAPGGDALPAQPAAGQGRGGLPFTGTWGLVLLLLGLALAVAGVWLVVAGRRRRQLPG
jgi:hypothetical protein